MDSRSSAFIPGANFSIPRLATTRTCRKPISPVAAFSRGNNRDESDANANSNANENTNINVPRKRKPSSFEEEGLKFLENVQNERVRPRRPLGNANTSDADHGPSMKPRPMPQNRQRFNSNSSFDTTDTETIYEAEVVSLRAFGAFVRLKQFPEVSGLVHISELSIKFVNDINEVVKIKDQIKVKLLKHEPPAKFSFSAKRARGGPPPDMKDSKYNRVVMLGGDWGDPWNRDGKTKWLDLGPRPEPEPDFLRDDPVVKYTRRLL